MKTDRLGAENTEVSIASIAGKTPAAVWDAVPQAITDLGTDAATDGAPFTDANYSAIPGTVHCLGKDCKVDEDGKLAGSWYFQPTSPMEVYVKIGEDTDYSAETNYARYGHWLDVGGTGEVTVNTYAWSNGRDVVLADLGESDILEGSATYSGTAVGMSLHKTFDTQGERQSIYSGRFTADVELEADFGAAPTVEGTIDNFQGNAVDPTWEVMLRKMTLEGDRQGTAGVARTGGSGQDGEWNNQAYGPADARPRGIFGDFNAHWTDGHAAGAYATTKD